MLVALLVLTKLLHSVSAQNPCFSDSAFNLTEAEVDQVENGIYLFITPSDERVPQGTHIQIICCSLSDFNMGALMPGLKFNPPDILSNSEMFPRQKGRTMLWGQRRILQLDAMNVTALPSINNTIIYCSSTIKLISNSTVLHIIGMSLVLSTDIACAICILFIKLLNGLFK